MCVCVPRLLNMLSESIGLSTYICIYACVHVHVDVDVDVNVCVCVGVYIYIYFYK